MPSLEPTALASRGYDHILPQLAMELAAALEPEADVAQKYHVTLPELHALQGTDLFQRLLADARTKFSALGNTAERIKVKALLLTEIGLDYMHGVMADQAMTPAARVGAFTAVKSLTGIDRPKETEVGTRFELKIVLPETKDGGLVIEGNILQEERGLPTMFEFLAEHGLGEVDG